MEQEDIVIEGIAISNIEMKKERLAALVAIFLSGGANNSTTCVIFNNANLCEERGHCMVVKASGG